MNPVTIISCISLALSSLALVVSFVRNRTADKANTISETNSWATLVLKHVEAEILNAFQDKGFVTQFCKVPFRTLDEKRALRSKLDVLRDESQRGIYMLAALTGRGSDLQKLKAHRDGIDDSYWDNDALAFEPSDRVTTILDRYSLAADAYLDGLRTFAWELSSNRVGLRKELDSKAKPPGLLPPGTPHK